MEVQKADAKNVSDDVIEVIVAIDLNPGKDAKPINGKESDEGEDGADWKDLCTKLLKTVAMMEDDKELSDKELIKEIEKIISADGEDAPEKEDAFSSYKKGGSKPKPEEEDEPEDEEEAPRKKSGGFKNAAKKMMGMDEEPEDEEEDDENGKKFFSKGR